MLFESLIAVALPKHFVFIPAKAIIVLQGQSGSVTCESEGASTVTLKWEKDITGSGSYQPVPESQVKVISDTGTNMLRAILQITNARLSDSGTYRCTVKVQHLSRSRLMTIRIDGKFMHYTPVCGVNAKIQVQMTVVSPLTCIHVGLSLIIFEVGGDIQKIAKDLSCY